MDEIKDKKTTGGESTANSGASANRERRPRNGQRGQRRQPGGNNKKAGAPAAADAAGEQRTAEQSKPHPEAAKQRRPDTDKKNPGAVNATEKNDRGGKRRAPGQNRSGRKNQRTHAENL